MKNPILQGKKGDVMLRGGTWFTYDHVIRTKRRIAENPTARDNGLGFRLFRSQEKS